MLKHADIPKWDVSPQIDPSASYPYYTISVWHVEAWRHTKMRCISTHETQCFIALLHHVYLTCGRMQTCPNEIIAPIKPSASERYYTMSSLTCGSMQTYWNEIYPPKLIPVFHSPTTPCPFDMWKHADIPKWDVSSPNLNPVLQSPTTPCPFDMWKHADIPKWDVSP